MATNNSSFKNLPVQIDWILPLLIFFNTYVIFYKNGIVEIIIGALTFLILLNGWISSKATSSLYSDSLLIIDILTISFYFFLVLTYYESDELVNEKYWLFSGLICFCYGLWDIKIKKLIPLKDWKKYYLKYLIYMFSSTILFILIFIFEKYSVMSNLLATIIGIALWLINLSVWHIDKIKRLK